jgi:hypothetical protein
VYVTRTRWFDISLGAGHMCDISCHPEVTTDGATGAGTEATATEIVIRGGEPVQAAGGDQAEAVREVHLEGEIETGEEVLVQCLPPTDP